MASFARLLRATRLAPSARTCAASAALGSLGCAAHLSQAEGAPQPPILRRPKLVTEITLRVPARLAGDFGHWLPSYATKLIELPGFLGAKLLKPVTSAGETPSVVFVLGGPGAGKGTQCARIVEARVAGRRQTRAAR